MLPPLSLSVRLSRGSVTLRAWGAHLADAQLNDLLIMTLTLGSVRDAWDDHQLTDLEPEVWASFRRLVRASLDGCELPRNLTWDDRLTLISAMWDLNDLSQAESKLQALTRRATLLLSKMQARQGQMILSMSG